MPWPAYIIEQFESAPSRGEIEPSELYGPYNTLLRYLFPPQEHFLIMPIFERPIKTLDFGTAYIIKYKKAGPVIFLEIQPGGNIRIPFHRAGAHDQIWEWYMFLIESVTINVLWGLSAMGTRLCLYQCERGSRRLEPRGIPKDSRRLNDRAPAERWDLDVLSPDGERRLREVAAQVKAMCAAIDQEGTSVLV